MYEENRRIIKAFIASRWDDQKVAEIAAFNEDGRMNALNPCCCLIGVHSSITLHDYCTNGHYESAKYDSFPKAPSADYETLCRLEAAYMCVYREDRKGFLADILREVMTERDSARERQAIGERPHTGDLQTISLVAK